MGHKRYFSKFFLKEGNMFLSFRGSAAIALLASTNLWALASTKGTPLGGMGTGYIIFNALTGQLASSGKTMPPAQAMGSEFTNYAPSSSGFYFFANGASKSKASTTTEDAKFPIYTADFGATGGVNFKLTAFGPIAPGQDNEQLAQSPLAFFDVLATNNNAAACTVAVALEFANGTLLGGASTGANDGNNAITWAGSTENAYMMVNCTGTSPLYTAGALGSFTTTGSLTTGAGNLVAAKCYVAAGNTAHYRFVMSWYQQWSGSKGNEGHWYYNYYTNAASGSKDCAVYGMNHFDAAEWGATSIVNRVMASNFPDWYKDRLLNNLYTVTHNVQCASDGRVGTWEGQYPIIGTLDQTAHAQTFFCFNWPQNQWRELQFWSRQQRQEANLLGQIHHDFNGCASGNWDANSHFFNAWDDYTHPDYWYQPNTTDWGDLQCMYIFKAYELMLATGNRDSLNHWWPKIKNSLNRMMNQAIGGGYLCVASIHSSYDDNSSSPEYVAGIQLAAWEAGVEIAKYVGDDSAAARIQSWYNAARNEFRGRFFTSSWCTNSNYCERAAAGYSWQRFLNLPAIWDSDIVVTGCNRLWSYYNAQVGDRNKLGKWHFYTYDHFGGTATAIGDVDNAMSCHQWDYNYYYTASPAYVFWQDLWSTNNTYHSYCTAPCVWHSYVQMTGAMLDNANHRLWIRPMLPSSMNKVLKDAPILNPRGWGTLNFNDSDNVTVVVDTFVDIFYQRCTVAFDSTVAVKEIVLKNDLPALRVVYDSNVRIWNNDSFQHYNIAGCEAETNGNAYEKNIRVTFADTILIGPGGAKIQVGLFNSSVGVKDYKGYRFRGVAGGAALSDCRIKAGKPIHYAVAAAGPIVLDLFAENGAKIGTIFSGTVSAGSHTAVWNGRSSNGMRIGSGIAVLRLISPTGVINRVVNISR
jgi:uncharacterized protein (DUF608 family)